MNEDLKELMQRAEHWPAGAKEEAISSLRSIEEDLGRLYELSSDDRAALERSEDDIHHGRFASDAVVNDLFDRYRDA